MIFDIRAIQNRLNKIDPEEAEEINKRREQRDHRDNLGDGDDVQRRGGPYLLPPPVQEKIRDGEEEREERGVREVQRQRERVGISFNRRRRRWG